jgi:hypothetical protein
MASGRSSVGWFWRDFRLSAIFVWAAFGVSLMLYFNVPKSIMAQHNSKIIAQPDNDTLYTGSIIVVPSHGNLCWQRMFDNRTGNIWDNGYPNCDEVVSQLIEQRHSKAISSIRLHAISDAFRSAGK